MIFTVKNFNVLWILFIITFGLNFKENLKFPLLPIQTILCFQGIVYIFIGFRDWQTGLLCNTILGYKKNSLVMNDGMKVKGAAIKQDKGGGRINAC